MSGFIAFLLLFNHEVFMLPTSENWIQTFSAHRFRPLGEFDSGEIDIRDIAHSLSMQCRFNGHCEKFYSVAEHCVLASEYVEDTEFALEALMHDATEAYLCDIPTPIKAVLPGYKEAEQRLEARIAKRFNLDHPHAEAVRKIDLQMLADEVAANMKNIPADWMPMPDPIGVKFHYWTPEQAEFEFLEAFRFLHRKP
jgi:uncharacterized protein